MKVVLVMNVGSSSIKYSLFSGSVQILKKHVENVFTKKQREEIIIEIKHYIFKKNYELKGVVHRVVHGKNIRLPSVVTKKLLTNLKKISELAPLHDIPEVEVIEACIDIFRVRQIAVFDTSFHTTIPEKASIYGIPYKFYKEGIKRYGFHGISHSYVTRGLKGKVISCHIGNGCSITAIKDGKSVDNSMGFTPLEGLVMGTRSGSIDPAIIPYLILHKKASLKEISELLNKKSGLLGISGITHDLRKLLKRKDKKSKLAVEIFIYQITKQIGAYVAALNGVDTIVFTGGVTENNGYIRERIINNLSYLNIKIDKSKNLQNDRLISSVFSKVKILVIPTNEEKAMLQEAEVLLR